MYKSRSIVDSHLHPSIVDPRLAEHEIGYAGELSRLTNEHNDLRERSEELRPEDECVLWYKLMPRGIKTFQQVAHYYKATYFRDMADALNEMTIGVRSRILAHKPFQTRKEQEKQSLQRCKLRLLLRSQRKVIFPDVSLLNIERLQDYMMDRNARNVPIHHIEEWSDEEEPEAMYFRLIEYMKNIDPHYLNTPDEACQKDVNRTLHSDILMFNRGILSAPRARAEVRLWRYINADPILIHHYTEKGNTVAVDRFLSTGFSPIATFGEAAGQILLQILLPPGFPFWILSAGIERTVSLEHREVVLPYTLDETGKTLNYGFFVQKVSKNASIKVEGQTRIVDYLVDVVPVMLPKPIVLNGFQPYCKF